MTTPGNHGIGASHQRGNARYEVWLGFVEAFVNLFRAAHGIPPGPTESAILDSGTAPTSTLERTTIVLCSPHPDDEALVGAFALRALREVYARVVNCAVTLGGDPQRKQARLNEVRASCKVLGFELELPRRPGGLGLDHVSIDATERDVHEWRLKINSLRELFDDVQPDIILMPHANDWHRTHEGTHYLAKQAALEYLHANPERRLLVLETEYWHPMKEPKLMLGVTSEHEATLVMAIAEHGGEVERNPYHLRHPARLMDNVRRGSEVVKGQGSTAETFWFAELYHASLFVKDKQITATTYCVIPPHERLEISRIYAMFDQAPAERIFDLVDKHDEFVCLGTKADAERLGLWRRSVHIFVLNSKGELLLCKRSRDARAYPGQYTSSAGGHVEAGQSYIEAARQELVEELGIETIPKDLGRFDVIDERGCVIHHLFLTNADHVPRPERREIESYEWVSFAKVREDIVMHCERYARAFLEAWKFYATRTISGCKA